MRRNQIFSISAPRGWKLWKFWELKKQTPTWCYIKLSSLIEIEFTPKPLLWGCIFCIKDANALVTNFVLELPCPLLWGEKLTPKQNCYIAKESKYQFWMHHIHPCNYWANLSPTDKVSNLLLPFGGAIGDFIFGIR